MIILALHQTEVSKENEMLVASIRVHEMVSLYESVVRDLQRSVEIVTPRAISAAVNFVITNGTTLDSATHRLEELIQNGTLFGKSEELMNTVHGIDFFVL